MLTKPTQKAVRNKRREPTQRPVRSKKTKPNKSAEPEQWKLSQFFDKHPMGWGICAYTDYERGGGISTHQIVDQWVKSLEFIVGRGDEESEVRLNRASDLLAHYTQGPDGYDNLIGGERRRERRSNQLPLNIIGLGPVNGDVTGPITNYNYAPVDRDLGTVPEEESENDPCDEIPAPKQPGGALGPASLHDIYEQMVHEDKWVLTSGRRVEDVIYKAYKAMGIGKRATSPAGLFVLDTSDDAAQGWFTKDEWNEITVGLLPLPEVDRTLSDSLEKFCSVKTTTRLRAVLNESDWMPDGVTYDKTLHSNLQWADMAIRKFLILLEAPNMPLIQPHLEGWYGVNIWSDILDACLLDLEGMTVERKECICEASAQRKNRNRDNLTERMKLGRRHDGIIRTLGDYFHEYGGMEEGRTFSGGEKATKWLGDTFKLVKSLRDMLARLHESVDDDPNITRRVQVVGISTAGLTLQYSRLGYPGVGYVCLLQRGPVMHVPTAVEKLSALLMMLLMISQLKELIRVSFGAVREGGDLVQSKNSRCKELLVQGNSRSGARIGWPPDTPTGWETRVL